MTDDEWLDGITDSLDMRLSKVQELVMNKKAWHAPVHGVTKSGTGLSDFHFHTSVIIVNVTTMVSKR